jgi:hypothetical protein
MAWLLDGSSAGVLIPELASNGLQQLIELEVSAFLGLTALSAPRSVSGIATATAFAP